MMARNREIHLTIKIVEIHFHFSCFFRIGLISCRIRRMDYYLCTGFACFSLNRTTEVS